MLPILYYETSVLCLDDNKKFLNFIKDSNIASRSIFSTNAQIIMDHIIKEKNNIAIIPEVDTGKPDERSIKFNLSNLRNRLDEPNKEDEISVLVVDYDMPNIDGIKFCKEVNKINPNICKIFLTGAAEKDEIIEAMQDGLIDFYISKSDKNLINKLTYIISRAKKEYFKRVCKEFNNILLNKGIYKTYIDDNVFTDFMNKNILNNDIIEYCLIEDIGSYFIRKNDLEEVIIISDEEKQRGTVEYLKDMINETLQKEILNGVKVLDSYSLEKDKITDKSIIMYDKYIYSAKKIPTHDKIFIARK